MRLHGAGGERAERGGPAERGRAAVRGVGPLLHLLLGAASRFLGLEILDVELFFEVFHGFFHGFWMFFK